MLRDLLRPAYLRLWALPRLHRSYRALSIAETFQQIYRTNAWGRSAEPFCSGSGSYGEASEQYCEFVTKFVRAHQVQSIVDLGCGDFVVGKRIVEGSSIRYTGIDVVPELINHHKGSIRDPRVSFQCANNATDRLPSADLYLVRQVLQHLSNKEIVKVLDNLKGLPRILISEDVPVHPKSFNRDKPHGPDVRSYWGSGVYVDKIPFSADVARLWELPLTSTSILRTALIDNTAVMAKQRTT